MPADLTPIRRDLAVADDDNPFAILDADWIPVAAFFCSRFAHTRLTPAKLCTDLAYWRSLGLTLADATRILMRFCHPGELHKFRWDNQLVPELEAEVFHALRRRHQLDDRRKRAEAARSPESAAGQVVRVADTFAMPTGG